MTLLEQLVARQQIAGLSDRKFGPRLGVSGALWNQTRNRRVPIRFEILTGVVREFPDLSAEVIEFLRSCGNPVQPDAAKEAAAPTEEAA